MHVGLASIVSIGHSAENQKNFCHFCASRQDSFEYKPLRPIRVLITSLNHPSRNNSHFITSGDVNTKSSGEEFL